VGFAGLRSLNLHACCSSFGYTSVALLLWIMQSEEVGSRECTLYPLTERLDNPCALHHVHPLHWLPSEQLQLHHTSSFFSSTVTL
jgi:hypothetical protein